MLPFTVDQFLGVFQQYNQAIWPMHVVAYILGIAALVFAVKKTPYSDRAISVILAFFWAWVGIAYHVSAWKGSDWYSNIQAAPALQVETGFVRYAPVQRTLSPEAITTTFIDYRNKHPIFSRIVCRIPGWKWDSSYEEFLPSIS